MASVNEMWGGLNQRAKIGIGVGAVLILTLTIGLGVWAYRPDYQVLFADVPSRDAAAMTAELDRMKVPYRLDDNGNTILVPKDLVYKTRLRLMGKDIPLHGAVGFEVFNNADFGMTEFVQKVNYQRAIQGELTRTIQSIEDVQSARVHLAIPEQGLFKKATAKPKASITLAMKSGRVLATEQILGIQRLVAASVPDIVAADVTVLDQHGVALTRVAGGETGLDATASQLDSKRSTEDYLLRKVTQVLDRTFGPGEAIASVDVALNMDQSRVTTEEVLPAKVGAQEGSPAGVVVRERQTIRESGALAAGKTAETGGVTTIESDYQVGRRVEQVVTATGSLRRMTVAVVVKRPLSEAQIEKLKEVIGLAVGFNGQRGDAIVVQTMEKFAHAGVPPAAAATDAAVKGDASLYSTNSMKDAPRTDVQQQESATAAPVIAAILAAAVIFGAACFLLSSRSRQKRKRLKEIDREQMLVNVRQWIQVSTKPEEVA